MVRLSTDVPGSFSTETEMCFAPAVSEFITMSMIWDEISSIMIVSFR